jgi:hypothetical protein
VLALALLSPAACIPHQDPPPARHGHHGAHAGTHGAPAHGGAPDGDHAGGYWCHDEQAAGSRATMCRPDHDACEAERQAAIADGLTTTFCARTSPVACFQLGGDPAPAAEWCAATIEDCELWRRIDHEKNGDTGDPCEWRH